MARDRIGSFMEAARLRGLAQPLDQQLRQRQREPTAEMKAKYPLGERQDRSPGDSRQAGFVQRRRLAAALAAARRVERLAANGRFDSEEDGLIGSLR